MSTTTVSVPAVTGMFARAVAQATGLSERELENLHPDVWGAPGHWRYVGGSHGGMFYTRKGIAVMIETLRATGHVIESMLLAAVASRELAGSGWASRWEADHE